MVGGVWIKYRKAHKKKQEKRWFDWVHTYHKLYDNNFLRIQIRISSLRSSAIAPAQGAAETAFPAKERFARLVCRPKVWARARRKI
jgi:hypothetical protein